MDRAALAERFVRVRAATEALAAPLSAEDQQVQSMPDASPTKWHRAHTTWFFETFALVDEPVFHGDFAFLFNSYYDTMGERMARARRGMITRPTAERVSAYREHVNARVLARIRGADDVELARLRAILAVGCAHEEQHQELVLTDILHAFSEIGSVYASDRHFLLAPQAPSQWRSISGGVVAMGASVDDASASAFAFDNEGPRHSVLLRDYQIASSLVTVGNVKEFMRARGYDTPTLWLSQGFATAHAHGWRAPGYARVDDDGVYRQFSLAGWRAPTDDEPAVHLSFWEAEAIARFLGARLPTEHEWEHAARTLGEALANKYDSAWQWTRSSYDPYPGFVTPAGALGEYNGKFMAQQLVLRGGSRFTPTGHSRASYRNFWPPDTRFQLAGARLARDA
ncbi:MAG TPA: ergothioneine biosynthesis protein EgtB [Myxococcota bacterium]|jgi:ergothioneine biosynthesis protein EgtB